MLCNMLLDVDGFNQMWDMRVSTSTWLDECGAFDPEEFPIIMHRALSPAPADVCECDLSSMDISSTERQSLVCYLQVDDEINDEI